MSNILKYFDVKVDSSCYLQNLVYSRQKTDMDEEDRNKTIAATSMLNEQAKDGAYKIISEAKKAAQNIKLSTIRRMKSKLETARNNGYEIGFNSGKQEALAQNRETMNELKNLLNTIDMQKTAILNNYESQIKELAIRIAEKIINKELDINDDAFINIYKNAVQDFNNQEWVKVIASDYEIEFATANTDILMSMVKGAKHIDIVRLGDAPRGTCIVETAQGIADSSIGTQLDRIREVFANAEIAGGESDIR